MDTEAALNKALPEVLRAIRETLDRHKLTSLIPSRLQFVQQVQVDTGNRPDRNRAEFARDNDAGDDAGIDNELLEGLVCRPVRDELGHIILDAHGRPIIECS